MHRHRFLELLLGAGGAALAAACGRAAAPASAIPLAPAAPPPTARAPVRAVCFDLFTLFDPRSVEVLARTINPERARDLCETWRSRLFQYSWLRASAGQYRDFRAIARDALDFAAAASGVALTAVQCEELVEAYSRLEPWPDTRDVLSGFRRAGLKLAPLANYSPPMLSRLLERAGLDALFDAQLSTDAVRTFKPDPRAYALGESTFGLPREQIAFAAFGGWDAAGAKWFGYRTFWVNRLGVTAESLEPAPDGSGPTLRELARFVHDT